ncbi:MAG: hypothetical protein ACHQFW_04450, partial [Chitinophagales bacterium]
VLKFLFISLNPIAGDEPFTLFHAQMPVADIIRNINRGNNPPLFEILLHFWIKLGGIESFWVKALPAFFSSATAVIIYFYCKKNFSLTVAIAAALIFSFSNYHLELAHFTRAYALLGLLSVASMYCFNSYIKGNVSGRILITLVIINVLLLYTHYLGVFIIAVQLICLLFIPSIRNYWKKYLLVLMGIIIIYLPQLFVFVNRFSATAKDGTWVKTPSGLESLYNSIVQFSNQPVVAVACIGIFISGIIYFIIHRNKKIDTDNLIVLIWFLFPFFGLFFISYFFPMFVSNYLVFFAVAYPIVIALTIENLFRKTKKVYGLVAAGIIVLCFGFTFNPRSDNERDILPALNKITELKTDKTVLIISPEYFMLNYTYYENRELFKDAGAHASFERMRIELNATNVFPTDHAEQNSDSIFFTEFPKIIYLDVSADFSAPGNNILPTIEKRYSLKGKYTFRKEITVYEFERE